MRRGGRCALLWLALALTVAELARGYVLTGFPWALIGHVWIGHAPAQVAALVGPSGLTLMTLLAAALLAMRRVMPVAVGACGLVAVAFGFGLWREAQPDPQARMAVLRLVQPNAEQGLKWDPDQARLFFERQLTFTAGRIAARSGDLAGNGGALSAGGISRGGAAASPRRGGAARLPWACSGWRGGNTGTALPCWGQAGARLARYDKHHLVPFGEYIPFGDVMYDWFGLVAFAAQQGNGYSPGTGPAVLDLGGDWARRCR